jgi:dipeptidyl aminopeptidase/acylaminoacyl peptidase
MFLAVRISSLRCPLVFRVLVAATLVLSFAATAQDAPVTVARVDEILAAQHPSRSIGAVAISPDGKRLAWIEGGKVHIASPDHPDRGQVLAAGSFSVENCSESDPAWSPDSSALAFFSDCAQPGEQADLYLSRFDGAPARRLTELHGYVASSAFSPDGTRIAFRYIEGATRPAGALAAMKPFSGVIGEDGIEIQRVAVARADVATAAAPAFATPANLHVFEFDWSPDSKSLAYIAADPPGENNWWVAKLYTQRIDSETSAGIKPNAVLSPADVSGPLHGLQIAVPRWSPDGRSIAFIGGLMSDQGATGGDVWVVSSSGGQPVDLTPNRPASPAWITWDGNSHIDASEISGGGCDLVRLSLSGSLAAGNIAADPGVTAFKFPGTVGDGRLELSLSATIDRSLFVFFASTFDHPPEIYRARPGGGSAPAGPIQISHFNDNVKPSWGKSVEINWTSEGFHVQGWLMLPLNYDPAKKYPLIVQVHGGPASAVIAHWDVGSGLNASAFSALGYFVLEPNPRGSFGQGEAFTQANRKDFGYGDLRDILAGVDTVLARYPVDAGRVGITGWSYGGFMTMFAVTQTRRFKAAVAGAGISDWLSYYGENSIDQWMIPYFGASVYDDPAIYAKSSAIDFIKRARTPALVVVGDRDGECPAPQSFEFWHALRDQHVPSQLVVYPNEGHGFVDPAHSRDVLGRAAQWFARYMPPD